MDYTKYKTFEKANGQHVFGITIMRHDIRIKLGLTCIEYVLLDFIKTWQDKNDTRILHRDLWIYTGIAPEHIPELWKNLIDKDMVYYDEETGLVTTASAFDQCFNKDSDFQDFWENYGRINHELIGPIGNRQIAAKVYRKTIKNLTPAALKEKARLYTEYCQREKKYILHASTWLNPMIRRYDDELTPSGNFIIKEEPVDPSMKNMVM